MYTQGSLSIFSNVEAIVILRTYRMSSINEVEYGLEYGGIE